MPENTTAQNNNPDKRAQLRRAALEYHEFPKPGKIAIAATKQMVNQHDLALAYSPGVAAPCEEIVKDPNAAFKYTSRGNLVGVVTNGTAVLGLGNIGPLAGKPVMEGKGCLFKKFANIDVFDIELAENDPDKLIDIIAALEPTLGGIILDGREVAGPGPERAMVFQNHALLPWLSVQQNVALAVAQVESDKRAVAERVCREISPAATGRVSPAR